MGAPVVQAPASTGCTSPDEKALTWNLDYHASPTTAHHVLPTAAHHPLPTATHHLLPTDAYCLPPPITTACQLRHAARLQQPGVGPARGVQRALRFAVAQQLAPRRAALQRAAVADDPQGAPGASEGHVHPPDVCKEPDRGAAAPGPASVVAGVRAG